MSHRAIVALDRGDGRYDVYASSEAGGDDCLERLLAPGVRAPRELASGPPVARDLTLEELLADHLDPIEHEALLVVGEDGVARPHVVLPYVLATTDGLIAPGSGGVAIELAGRDDGSLRPAYVRGWFHGATEVLGEAVDAERLAPAEAIGRLDDGVRRLAGDDHAVAVIP